MGGRGYLTRHLVVATLVLLTGVSLHKSPTALAAPPKGSIDLNSIQIFQTSVNGKLYVCGNLPPYAPGRIVGERFIATKTEIKNLNSALKKASTAKKIKSYKAKIKALKNSVIAGNSACAISSGPGVNPNFDIFGNVTAVGKVTFGIPASMSVNVNAGITAWNQTCNGCHQASPKSLSIRSFPGISQRITQSPMNFMVPGEVSLEKIASIVAFANY